MTFADFILPELLNALLLALWYSLRPTSAAGYVTEKNINFFFWLENNTQVLYLDAISELNFSVSTYKKWEIMILTFVDHFETQGKKSYKKSWHYYYFSLTICGGKKNESWYNRNKEVDVFWQLSICSHYLGGEWYLHAMLCQFARTNTPKS